MAKEPNILFIIVDALRTKNLGCYGYSKPTTPNIDSLAQNGILFEDAYSCINATDPSLTTIFSGKYPVSHGIIHHGTLRREELLNFYLSGTSLLPEILQEGGYRTMAVDWLGRWHRKGYDYYSGILREKDFGLSREQMGWDKPPPKGGINALLRMLVQNIRRFKVRYLPWRLQMITRTEVYADAPMVTDQAINLMKENLDRKFFLFLHYWDTHSPYNSPASYTRKYLENRQDVENKLDTINDIAKRNKIRAMGATISEMIAMYDGSISLVDEQIGRLISALSEYGILDQTLIIFTADHGESLTEHGIYFDHHGLYDDLIHVPLIISYPELPKGRRISGYVQHFDIVPSILDILGIEVKADLDGKSFLPLVHGETKMLHPSVFVEEALTQRKRVIVTPKYKYICALSDKEAKCTHCGIIHGGIEELYDLDVDPGETHNIVNENRGKADELKKALSEYIQMLESKRERGIVKGKIQRLRKWGKV